MMKAAQLRQAILQAAVQGKLVPQNPHDEPASVLLERIRVEKAKLIKAGKLKNEKPLPPVSEDEILYALPDGWLWYRLGELGDWGAGATPLRTDSRYYTNGTINWLKTGELNDAVVYESQEKITDLALKECSLRLNKVGDVLVAMYGATIGKLAVVGTEMTTNQACCACTPFTGIYNWYLFFLLKAFKNILTEQGEGGAQPNISRVKIRTQVVPVPPVDEQIRIVAKIEELMAMCDELEIAEKKSDALDEHFMEYLPKSILQAAVQGKLVPQNPSDEPASVLLERIRAEKAKLIKAGKLKKEKPLPPITADEIPYDLPDGWVWCRLGDISDLRIGKTPARAESSYWSDGAYPWVSIADMITGHHINSTKEKISQSAYELVFKKAIVPKGSLLFSFKLSIGKVSILDIDAFTNEAICSITPYHRSELIDYLFRVIPILDLLSGAKDAIKGKTLNSKSLADVLIPLPPIAEQQRIVAKVDELMTLCANLKTVAENVEMSETKQATIILLGRPQDNEPLRMAARGTVNKEVSEAHKKAREDMFNDD